DPLLCEQGLLSRCLVSAPDSAAGTRMWHDPDSEYDAALRRYGGRLLDILERPMPLASGARQELAPRTLPLGVTARRQWIGFADHVESRVGTGGELELVRALAAKLAEHAARIAGVLTLTRDIEAGEIAAAEMEAAIEIAQHYAAEAIRLDGASRVSG